MKDQAIPYKIYLQEEELPKAWYNLRADMKNKPAPLLNPATLKPMTADELKPVFCDELVAQELDDTTPYIEIPQEIRDFYKMYRPSPLVRAYCLEEKLQTPAKIYYKFEGNNTSGSHKLNSAIAQAYYAKKQGLKGVTTETGAGQWGTALSMACSYFGLDCKVYMVKVSYEQKPFRREVMRTYGANVTPSPSDTTQVGRKILEAHPGTGGSLAAPSPRPWKPPPPSRVTGMCWAASCPRWCSISPSSAWKPKPPWISTASSRISSSAAPAAAPTWGLDRPLHGPKAPGGGGLPHHRHRARLLPQLHPGQIRLRFLRYRHGLPPGQNVYPGLRLHPRPQPRGRPSLPRHELHPVPALR